MAIEIFCCYAREDEVLLQKIKAHLILLQRQGLITIWSDTDIEAGREWEKAIEEHLNTAHIILLLISADFMASEYCYSKEMNRAMERHERGEARVIPVILRSVYWHEAPFGKLQALPIGAKPVTSAQWHNEDEALLNVAKGIRKALEQLTSPKASKKPASTPSVEFGGMSDQQNIFAKPTSSKEIKLKSSSSLSSSFSVLHRQGKWIMQGKNFFLTLSLLDTIFLLLSLFLSPNSTVPIVAILVAACIFISSLVESALLQQWYWFVGILLFNPLTGFIYYLNDPGPSTVKWHWFVSSVLLSPLVGACYNLFGPKKKPRLSITHTAFKQLILTTSFIGLIVLIIAFALQIWWAIYIGCDFYAVGYILAIIQVVRLKHGDWVIENSPSAILILPILLFAILYAVVGPKTEED